MRNALWSDKILFRYTNTRITDGEITGGITIGTETAYCNRTMEDGRASTCWFVTVHGLQDSNVCIYKHCLKLIKSRLCQAILITINSFLSIFWRGFIPRPTLPKYKFIWPTRQWQQTNKYQKNYFWWLYWEDYHIFIKPEKKTIKFRESLDTGVCLQALHLVVPFKIKRTWCYELLQGGSLI